MELRRLESGYWYARWSREIWAQWPTSRQIREDDFFHASYTATPERMREADAATAARASREDTPHE